MHCTLLVLFISTKSHHSWLVLMAPPSKKAADFETALRSQLHSQFFSQLPSDFLQMRVGDFLQLAGMPLASSKASFTINSHQNYAETPKTATRRSTRTVTAPSTFSSITKSVKKRLFAFATPSKGPAAPSTPHLTIKSSAAPGASVTKPQTATRTVTHSPSRRSAPSQTPRTSQTPRFSQTPRAAQTPATTTGIVQFQLDDGKLVDVDFSRSPKSALQDANLLGSEAIGEVKAKIETYANQFMQYLKFFKKFKPSK